MKIERLQNVRLAGALDATMRSRKDLASALEIAPTTLSALVNGRLKVSGKMKQKICVLLGVPEAELFE